MKEFYISSSSGAYPVSFARKAEELAGSFSDGVESKLFIIDRAVLSYFRNIQSYAGERVLIVEAVEGLKSFPDGVLQVFEFLSRNRANKGTTVYGIGGGVVQDVVTFCASLFHRGLPWVYIPTTLLSMVDSCIGAKSSINLQGRKNQLGNFYAPQAIRICPEFLNTLPHEEILSGLAEAYKILLCSNHPDRGLLSGSESWNLESLSIETIIYSALGAKKAFIEEDEFDKGIRRVLNFGHTYGHAIEAVTANRVSHGYAVILGIDMANKFSWDSGRISEDTFRSHHSIFKKNYNFSEKIGPHRAGDIIRAMKSDKKFVDGEFRLILLDESGVNIHTVADVNSVEDSLRDYLLNWNLTE
jgi:3-dehydroquinate synthase